MLITSGANGRETEIINLFTAVFSQSEGAEEGALIGALVRDMLSDTPAQDLFVFTAEDEGGLTGAVCFSRMRFQGDARAVFILSPAAVATAHQGEGVGSKMMRHGLERLRVAGVDIVLTYGDPAYYGRLGFVPISAGDIPPPHALSQPEGWLGQSLTDAPLSPLTGPSHCVKALSDPAIW